MDIKYIIICLNQIMYHPKVIFFLIWITAHPIHIFTYLHVFKKIYFVRNVSIYIICSFWYINIHKPWFNVNWSCTQYIVVESPQWKFSLLFQLIESVGVRCLLFIQVYYYPMIASHNPRSYLGVHLQPDIHSSRFRVWDLNVDFAMVEWIF